MHRCQCAVSWPCDRQLLAAGVHRAANRRETDRLSLELMRFMLGNGALLCRCTPTGIEIAWLLCRCKVQTTATGKSAVLTRPDDCRSTMSQLVSLLHETRLRIGLQDRMQLQPAAAIPALPTKTCTCFAMPLL